MDTADHIYSSPDRLILVGGGSFNEDDLIRNARNADVIAVDGGLHACQEAGITPCAVIGDMDSAGAAEIAALGGAVPIHHIAEQDSTIEAHEKKIEELETDIKKYRQQLAY